MGVRASWAVVKGGDMSAALSALGLTVTGEIDFFGESQIVCAQLPGCLFLLGDFDFVTPERLRLLSVHAEVVGCQAYETIMKSAAFAFREGRQVWAVSHNPEIARDHLEVIGTPPTPLAAIREDIDRQIAADDRDWVDHTFEVPLKLMKTFCGFRADRGDPLPPEAVFYVVEPLQTGAKAVRQARTRTRHEALTSSIENDLYPAVEAMGFERLVHHPAFLIFHPFGATNAFVRFRGEISEVLTVKWGFDRGAPYISVTFFVRRGAEPRAGTFGRAQTHGPTLRFWDRLLGRDEDPDEASKTILKARDALAELDRHLRTGEVGRHITPACYEDSGLDLGTVFSRETGNLPAEGAQT